MNNVVVRLLLEPRLGRIAMAVATAFAGAAHAQDGGPSWRFGGFGTLGVAHLSERNADFTSSADQPSGAGATQSWSFNPDTKFGGQVDVKLNELFSATAQVSVRQRYNNNYNPELMMAFAKWQATPEVAFRLGRMPIPVFLTTDYRDVSYAQTTVRPPVDTYHWYFLRHIDGADVTWSTNVGGVAFKSQAFAGAVKLDTVGAYLDATPFFGANVTADVGDATFRASVARSLTTDFSIPALQPVFEGVRFGFPAGSLGAGSPALPASPDSADRYQLINKTATFVSFGFKYDPGAWFVTSEITWFSGFGVLPSLLNGYVIGGMRFGDWTPYASLSATRATIAGSTTNNPVLDGVRTSFAASSQKSLALGLRWDVVKNVALKTQFDRVNTGNGSTGQLTNIQPGFKPGSGYSVFSAVVDFVF